MKSASPSTSGAPYSLGEEIANSITHGIGVLLSIAALVILVVLGALHGNAWHVVSFSIFGSSLVILYMASTLYHSFPQPTVKKVFKVLDHSAIFILIAGTYTPFLLISLRGVIGWSMFGVIWGLAVGGILCKALIMKHFARVSLGIYVLMGWLSVLIIRELYVQIPLSGMILLFAGGICYTLGVPFYIWRKLPYHHAVWHLFVLAGSITHFFAVMSCL